MAEKIGELLVKLSADIAGLKSGLSQGIKELSGFKRTAQEVQSTLSTGFRFALGIAGLTGAIAGFHQLKDAVKAGITEIDKFKITVAAAAGSIADLSDPSKIGTKEAYAQAKTYGEDMYDALQLAAARYYASGEDMIQAWNVLLNKGVVIQKDQVDNLGVIVDKIKLITAGQMGGYQIAQELRAVLNGTANAASALAQLMKDRLGDQWEEVAAKMRDTQSLAPLAEHFQGAAEASEDIGKTLDAQKNTLSTLINMVARQGLAGAYEDVVGILRDINDWLVKHGNLVANDIASAWSSVKGIIANIAGSLSWIVDGLGPKLAWLAEQLDHMVTGARMIGNVLTFDIAGADAVYKEGKQRDAYRESLRIARDIEAQGGEPGDYRPAGTAKPPPVKKISGGGDGGGGKEKAPEDLTRLIEKELKAQLDLEIAKSQESLRNLKAEQEKKKAVLKASFEEGKLDGAAYYAELLRMDEEYYQGAADLIRQKLEAENKLYPQQIAALEKSGKLSPEALQLEKRAMALEHQERVLKLQGELTRTLIEQEKELANQTQEEARYRKEISDILAEGAEALALGPIAEKEAEINRLLRERMEIRKRIPAENLGEFDAQTEGLVQKKTIGEEAQEWAETFSGGIRNFVETVVQGGADITKALNSFFKQIFSQSLEKGFKQLTQWLTDMFTGLFGTLGSTLANAVMGVIGLIGMLLTSGGGSKSWTPSDIQSNVTSSKEVRGVIAGETSLPIAEISGSMSEAMAPANRYLAEIATNTRGLKSFGINITIEGLQEAIKEAFDRYFADALMRVA